MTQTHHRADSDAPLTDDLRHRLRDEQIALLSRNSPSAVIGAVLTAVYVCWLLLKEYSVVAVGIWYGALVIVTLIRVVLHQKHLHAVEVLRDPHVEQRTAALMFISIVLYGFVWCIPSTLLLTSDPTLQVMMTVFLVGLSAAGLGSLTPVRFAYAAFLVPFMLPIALYYFYLGDTYFNVALGILAYMIAMLATARRNHLSIERTLRLQLENEALAERVQREKEVVERSNRDLEQQISQRERTEAELRVAKAHAESASRAKSQFLANMSHELRTPLNGILGMSDLLLRSLTRNAHEVKQVKHAQTIRRAGERLLHLIDDILDMARIEAGALRLEVATFAPRALIGDVLDLTSKDCADKGLEIGVEVAPDVPEQVRGDPHRIRQVVTNLVANAIKFTDRGRILIRLAVVAPAGDAANVATQDIRLRWSVVDTGIGIAPDARQQLFQPFSQLDDSATRKFGGSGLGLAICQQLVHALNGKIGVESIIGQGSTFWFEIAVPPAEDATIAGVAPIQDFLPAVKARILVAEDNVTNGQLVTEMLELAGCSSITVVNGREALDKLQRERFDAVLMDWHMPEMDGVSATRAWREHEHQTTGGREHVPIIALTASVLPGDRETCLRAGMDDFLPKPFTFDELIAVVQRWLPKPEATSEL